MLDLDTALAQTAPRKGPSCSVGKLLAELDPDQRAKLEAALADREVQTAHLTRALVLAADRRFDPASVGRHRKGTCNCGS